jgi:hypothetical protein
MSINNEYRDPSVRSQEPHINLMGDEHTRPDHRKVTVPIGQLLPT